jgi:AraC family transcriptional regulator of adaptative response/methylated-DNA-[protein]-cysteine methyltransferase
MPPHTVHLTRPAKERAASEPINGTGEGKRGQSGATRRMALGAPEGVGSAAQGLAEREPVYEHLFASRFGWVGCAGTERGLAAVTVGESTRAAASAALACERHELGLDAVRVEGNLVRLPGWFQAAVATLQRYAEDGSVDLAAIPVDYQTGTALQRRIWNATRAIPPGETVSYKQLAERVGLPRGARPVGQAMARNRLLLVIPCHRVVSSSGALTGYSNPVGLPLKERLLAHEAGAAAEARQKSKGKSQK